uniref:S4/Hsp/ tRNA synthetase RNA-binding domain surface n=1 Tax=Siphoviridae sp. ct5op20 TaxID=2826295 RepID=A0A8S5NS25_9CAUD|nr:MAG TPA: S4/Hsp/ tRNA synthetase RNA-binding domain surface [Siphoviridae sp. ct5op20]
MSIHTLYQILQRNNIQPNREERRRAIKQGG